MIYALLILLIIVPFCIALGFKKGLFLEFISFFTLCISFILTFVFFEDLTVFLINFFTNLHEGEEIIIQGMMMIESTSFTVLLIFFYMISLIISKLLFGKRKIELMVIVDKYGGVLLGAFRGLIIASLVIIILTMMPGIETVAGNDGNIDFVRNIYLITPRCYEYLSKILSSGTEFDSIIFLNTYGSIFKKEMALE